MPITIGHLEFIRRCRMKIQELFLKDIHRNIEGVITASKAADAQVYQELDEYVVTKELQAHFNTFFDAYKKGILGDTSKMGVWIQGFFGSGKSHFLKILAYLLENKEINGKTAFQFFTEGDVTTRKIKDDMTIANMRLAADIPTNVILFNVESKHQTGVEEKSSLVNVFLKVFNDSLGYSTNPMIADLERSLAKEGKYEVFKQAFFDLRGKNWTDERHQADFLQDFVVESLVTVDFMSEQAAQTWFSKMETEYKISIEEFAVLVQDYLANQQDNQHIVFLVDEIGQYIGGNSSLTLQLQTIVEELGTKCHGKAWVIVTSQQAIDKITDIAGAAALDFSKIKGRFETTLSLSSANADEVIQKRILSKNPMGQEYLEADYPNHENDIKLALQFEDSPELKLYSNAQNYADVYPFIPYQFKLLADILTQISKHSIQGSNLSRGERSLLAFFKETAERNAANESDILVSLDQFYPSLEKWLNETDNAKVIKQAYDNQRIMPEEDTFNIDVLKVLFMIKYVDQNIKPTLNNITNLMVRSVNVDKIELRKKVETALKILIGENLIRQNLQSYVFQTDEEQEVTRLINNIELAGTDIENKLAVDIFDDKVGKNSFAYVNRNAVNKRFDNRYIFSYNQYIDDYPYKKNINPQLEIKIITPLYDNLWNDEAQLELQSSKNQMLINLPVDQEFMNHVRTYLKVEKYITTAATNSAIKNFAAVKSEKTTENQELGNSIRNQLDDILKKATFYYNNSKLELSGSDFKSQLTDGLQQMAKLVYFKNDLVDAAMSEQDINHYLADKNQNGVAYTENQNVLEEVKKFILFQSNKGITVTMKTLRDNFIGKDPYGFVNEDLEWVIARMFKEGDLNLIKNGIPLTTTDNVADISKVIFERKAPEKIRVELRIKIGITQKKLAKTLGYELFRSKNIVDENNDDTTKARFVDKTEKMIMRFKNYLGTAGNYYPQDDVIQKALKVLTQVVEARDTRSFFDVLTEKQDELFDWSRDMEDIDNFHSSNQIAIWNKAKDSIRRIENSTIKESTEEIDEIIRQMKQIMQQSVPYKQIPKLSELNNQFNEAYVSFIESKAAKAEEEIILVKEAVLDDLASRDLEDKYNAEVTGSFGQLLDELAQYERLDQIALAPVQADTLQKNFTRKFTDEENRLRAIAIEKEKQHEKDLDTSDTTKTESFPNTIKESTKKLETVYLKTLLKTANRVSTKEDIEAFTNDLKEKLLARLTKDNELDIHV